MSRSRSFVERLTAIVVEHPWRALIAGLAVMLALAPGLSRLKQDSGFRMWYQEGSPALRALDDFERQFGAESASLVVVHSPSGIFDTESVELLRELTRDLWKVDEVVRVESLSNFSWVHAEGDDIVVEPLLGEDHELTPEFLAERERVALGHEQLPGYLVTPDGKTTVLYLWMQPALLQNETGDYTIDNDSVAHINALNERLAAFEDRGDHVIYVSGFPAQEHYMQLGPGAEMQGLMPIILGSIVILLLAVYRRPAGLLPMVVVVSSVVGALGVAGWLGIGLNQLTLMAPSLIVILAVSNSVHLLQPYFRGIAAGLSRREAGRRALEKTLSPYFFACVTTSIGFVGLLAIIIPPIRQLGALMAIATMILWLFGWLLLGPLLVLLPIKTRVKEAAKELSESETEELEAPTERAIRAVNWIDRYKGLVIGTSAAIMIVSLVLASQNRVTFKPDDFFDPQTDVRQAADFFKKEMGVALLTEIAVDGGEREKIKDPAWLRKVEALQDWLKSKQEVVQVVSLIDIFKEMNRALHGGDDDFYRLPETRRAVADQYLLYTLNLPLGANLNDRVTIANDALRITVLSRLETSPEVSAAQAEIYAKAAELGLDISVTGRAMVAHSINRRLVEGIVTSLAAAILMIAFALIIFLRSVRHGLLSLALNVAPLVIGAGIIFRIMGQSYNMGTIAALAIALGVAVDDTVHFLTGYRRLQAKGYSAKECITHLWSAVVPAMIITSVIMAVSFGSFILVTFPVTRHLGVFVSTILVTALLIDTVLLPAVLLSLKRNKKDAPPVAMARGGA